MIPLLLLVLCLSLLYCFFTKNNDYWLKRKVKHEPPIPLFGNMWSKLLASKTWPQVYGELYNKYAEEKVIGYYKGRTPLLIVKDLDLVRKIVNVDFASFRMRGNGIYSPEEQITANVLHIGGDAWKLLRKGLTPAFTGAKLRAMFPLVARCAERLQAAAAAAGGACDAYELMARFTTDCIGACVFGIDMDTINNERSNFRDLGKRIFHLSPKLRISWALADLFPELRNYLNLFDPSIEDSLTVILKEIMEQRDWKPSGRNDFIDLFLEIEAKGKLQGNSIEKCNPDGSPIKVEMEMDLKCMVAQLFIFFAAGFETSATAASVTLHELAYNPVIQTKIQAEIDQVMSKYDNKLCYDSIAEMPLLLMAFKEAMRMFSPAGVSRMCTERYTIPELDITIDPGVIVIIPVQSIHMDEKYFDNPGQFRPERFSSENMKARHKYAFIPFGSGPRACIGENIAFMQSLAGLAAIFHKFTVEPAENSRRELKGDPSHSLAQANLGGLPLKIKLRKMAEQ